MVPGHEFTGAVTMVGEDVSTYGVNDRVGVGGIVNSCGGCGPCRDGMEQRRTTSVTTTAR